MNDACISIKNLTKRVRGRQLLDDISFNVKKGTICGLLGPNGAGKTTLIRLLTGLVMPSKGEIVVNGRDIVIQRKQAVQHIGAIVEAPIFFSFMTGRENLRNLARLHPQLSKQEQKKRVEEVLAIVSLQERGDDKVKTYSLGMKQRLGIAQALLGKPSVLILDEPVNGLDPMGIRDIRELLLELNHVYGLTILISSHLLDELQKICQQLVVLRHGELIWSGEKEELALNHESLEDAFIKLVSQ
ncbi:ATP-binding cassette domain-containing protein [Alkalihalobacillus oceani]|uniref:ABC transporter ATP-binding protein n=1 Tax=Halalkalibacter oceani TaxID=1653776 RepID=UPI00203D7C8D|nr:ATP-binding cassette domain-containing protein [Halalkalibacter oceani]MCM3761415.1 ATP-binding cassette domain-containing protein [Halalkalibacter oceani]